MKKYNTDLLELWLKGKGLELKKEYKFHPKRKWLVDYAILEWKIIIEVEGLFSKKNKNDKEWNHVSRHRSISGFKRDMEKYNAATILGWQLFRIDSATFKKTQGINVLQMWYDERQRNLNANGDSQEFRNIRYTRKHKKENLSQM